MSSQDALPTDPFGELETRRIVDGNKRGRVITTTPRELQDRNEDRSYDD